MPLPARRGKPSSAKIWLKRAAQIENNDLAWRPGLFVTAQIVVAEVPVDLRIPRLAVQTIGGKSVAFVRTPEGFQKRDLKLGNADDASVEVVGADDPPAGSTVRPTTDASPGCPSSVWAAVPSVLGTKVPAGVAAPEASMNHSS